MSGEAGGEETSDFRFRRSGEDWGVNLFHHHIYHGGGSSDWAHARDEYYYIDNIKVVAVE